MNHHLADEFVREHLSEPFNWRTNNCVTFVAGFVQALHGYDPLGDEGRPADVKAALREVRGYGSLEAAASSRWGTPLPPSQAGYGDVVLVPGTEGVGDSLGICIGPSVLAPGETELVRLPLSLAKHAWKTAPKPS